MAWTAALTSLFWPTLALAAWVGDGNSSEQPWKHLRMEMFAAVLAAFATAALGSYVWNYGAETTTAWRAWKWMTERATSRNYEDESRLKDDRGPTVEEKKEEVEVVRFQGEGEQEEEKKQGRGNREAEETNVDPEEGHKEGAWLGTVSFADIPMAEEPEGEEKQERDHTPKLAVRLGAARKAGVTSSPPPKEFAPPSRVMQAQPPKSSARTPDVARSENMTAPPVRDSPPKETASGDRPVTHSDGAVKKPASLPKLPPRPASKTAAKGGDETQSKGRRGTGAKHSTQATGDRKGSSRGTTVPTKSGMRKQAGQTASHKKRNGVIFGVGAAALALVGGVAAVSFSGRARESGIKKMTVRKMVLVSGDKEKNSQGKHGKKSKTFDQALEDSGLLSSR